MKKFTGLLLIMILLFNGIFAKNIEWKEKDLTSEVNSISSTRTMPELWFLGGIGVFAINAGFIYLFIQNKTPAAFGYLASFALTYHVFAIQSGISKRIADNTKEFDEYNEADAANAKTMLKAESDKIMGLAYASGFFFGGILLFLYSAYRDFM